MTFTQLTAAGEVDRINPTLLDLMKRKGVYTKQKPLDVSFSLGVEEFDAEGRFIMLTFPKFYFITVYFPNGGQGEHRIDYKLRYYDAFLKLCKKNLLLYSFKENDAKTH